MEAKTIRKVRIRILPFVFLLFIVALLDRTNIVFAALTMNKELAITSQQYGLLFGIFFFGYFLFEIPSNLLLHKIGARLWIARILLTWGAVVALSGLTDQVVVTAVDFEQAEAIGNAGGTSALTGRIC